MSTQLQPDVEAVFATHLRAAKDADLEEVRGDVRQYLADLEAAAEKDGLFPIDIARELAARLEELLDACGAFTDEQRVLVVAAARYFVSRDDARPDTSGPLGLDDDAAVYNHVVARLGLGERALDL